MQTLLNRSTKIYSDRVKSVRGWVVNAVTIYEQKDSGVNEKQTVFLIIKGVNKISYAYIYRCTTTSDQ